MGCFLGCFGGDKLQKRRKHRVNRASPHRHRNRVQNVQQENVITLEHSVRETAPLDLVSELGNKPEVVEERSPSSSSRKRVTFNSNVTTYEHVPVHESTESLSDYAASEEDNQEDSKPSNPSSKDGESVTSSVGSYPPNHRYHNARESDDEADEFGDSDLDDDDDDDDDDDEDYYSDEDINARFLGHEVCSESVSPTSVESRTRNFEVEKLGSKTNGRDRSDYINSVLNPVENITQWKAVKSKGTSPLKPQKENFPNFGSGLKAKPHQLQNANQEIAVDASLSNWLASTPSKNTTFSGVETTTTSECCTSARSFDDRPILGALTVEELRQISSSSPLTRKSPSRSPDEMPIIGSVGTYWNNSSSSKHCGSVASFKGIANATSKYRGVS